MFDTVIFNIKYRFLPKLREKMSDDSGMGTIEVVLILVVLIGLVLIFKGKIRELLNGIMDQINSDAESVYKSSSLPVPVS